MKFSISILVAFIVLSTSAIAADKPAVPAKAGPVVKLDLGTGTAKNKEEMVFSKDKLTAKAGAKISLVFKNNASKSMMHNFVLVKPGKAQGVIDASVAARTLQELGETVASVDTRVAPSVTASDAPERAH